MKILEAIKYMIRSVYLGNLYFSSLRERERRKRPKKRDAIPSGVAPRNVSPALQETNKKPLVPSMYIRQNSYIYIYLMIDEYHG